MAVHLERGSSAEQLAAAHLASRGLRVLARNFRGRTGELDLIVLDGPVLAIVEVRQRSRGDFGGPAASVTRRKQRLLIRAAREYLWRNPGMRRHPVRFDIVAVHGEPGMDCRIEWIKAAFAAGNASFT